MPIRTHAWALLLERLPLRETLDALKGYSYPVPAREVLCQRYALTEQELNDVLKLHASLYQPRRQKTEPPGKRGPKGPTGPRARDGMDLLLDIEELRAEVDQQPLTRLLTPSRLQYLLVRYNLQPVELSRVLEAHTELMARP